LGGARETKNLLVEETADALTGTAGPESAKLPESYHVFYNQLSVLRTGLTLKIYQRERKLLPATLTCQPGSSLPIYYNVGMKYAYYASHTPPRGRSAGAAL